MNKLLPSVKSLITLAALLCFLFQASAAAAQKVSLSVRNATVKAAIERLQKDYGYSFVIKTKDADVNKKITGKPTPTAAKAPSLTKLPTTQLSTIL